ncbi:ABC transporter permease [Ostreibacterium oceani]|uniref:ABC transporter permease subunit n=1 Tax=Ostreibacterium oceani TaxID=2654998 RepID=A0A6N7EYD9_9GAMM|nr:ABC transporter permease [Ostreibacterium oceani]MPV86575.1 ABC transporter permease subunit [Ostreibacterium oceani]
MYRDFIIEIYRRGVRLWPIYAVLLAFWAGSYAQTSDLLADFAKNFDDWLYLLKQNIYIVLASGLTATILGVSSGILMTRPKFRRYANVFVQGFNILSAVPTLAILAIIMTLTGIGFKSAFIGLVTVTILPIVKNTFQGIDETPDYLIEAARGQGMTDSQILWRVQLPNALYIISAGIRTGFALNVGTSPLITLIAADSLGEFIFTGIQLREFNMLLIGSISVAFLAVLMDFFLSKCQYWAIPKGVNPQRFESN